MCHAVRAAAFVVDGGIYRHEFVAQAVVDGLMRAGMETGVPVLSVSLTPHQYQETEHHAQIYHTHFVKKGREAARAALMLLEPRASIEAYALSGGWARIDHSLIVASRKKAFSQARPICWRA